MTSKLTQKKANNNFDINTMKKNEIQGFTLAELSIVLIIIALAIGGVVSGQSLIESARNRKVIVEMHDFQTATMTFKGKYNEYPGDMPNATSFWGSMSDCGATNPTANGTQTCNGNGNGFIRGSTSGYGRDRVQEWFLFWQHLSNAKLISGEYSGVAGSGRGHDVVATINTPASSLKEDVAWHVAYSDFSHGSYSNFFELDTEVHNFILGGASDSSVNDLPVFSAQDVWRIDKKMDDGHASKGNVMVVNWDECTTATADDDYQDYDFSLTDEQCAIVFRDVF